MKKYLLTIMLLLICGCSKEITEITLNDKLTYEYDDKINLYDLVNIKNGTFKTDDYLINTSNLGIKEINFKYLNNNNQTKQHYFEINVVDTTNPIIFSANTFYTTKGKEIDLLSKIVCGDNYDRETNCIIDGDYDINKIGEYNLKFVATDSSNNQSEKSFKLVVQNKVSTSTNTSKTSLKDIVSKHKKDNTMIGIDVSKWQENIDWQKVKDDGIEFAMLRIGYGHNSSNDIVIDEYFLKNIKKAKEANIPVGVYFYSYAKNTNEAIEQAKWIVKTLNNEKLDLPIAFDWEIWNRFNTYKLNFVDLNDIAEAFMNEIENNGYKGMLYGSKNYLEYAWNLPNYSTWLAHYTTTTNYSKDYYIWQICSNGQVSGIKGNVDLDILYK